MSEVAGRMATQVGARFLEKPQGGKRKTNGWRAGGTSCTRTYFRGAAS